MTTDELREGLSRLAEQVTPEPDPYQRLLTKARRRRQRRLSLAGGGAVGMAAVLVAIQVVGPIAALTGGHLKQADGRLAGQIGGIVDTSPVGYEPAAAVDSPWVRRLLDSPARGNLAADRTTVDAVAAGFLTARSRLMIDPALTRVRVLFAHDLPSARAVVVAFVNDDHATIRTAFGGARASVPALLAAAATEPQALSPVVLGGKGGAFLALAPSGCVAETSSDGRLGVAGAVARTWRPIGTDGFVVADRPLRWRFTCDGVVRQSGPTTVAAGPPGSAPLAAAAARDLSDAMAASGLASAPVRTLWSGTIPGGSPAAVVVACHPVACAAVLATGGSGAVATRVGVGRPGLVALPIPGAEDRVLVVGPPGATVELLDAGGSVLSQGRLTGGIGVLTVNVPAVTSIQVYDAGGNLVDTLRAAPDLGSVNFGEAEVVAW